MTGDDAHVPKPLERSWPAVPASIAAIRAALAVFATAAGADEHVVAAVKLAVSEAATNAVLHAYVGRAGPGGVHVAADHGIRGLSVVVSDDGRGMVPRDDSPGSGFGMSLIEENTDGFDVADRTTGGTAVQMRFRLAGRAAPA